MVIALDDPQRADIQQLLESHMALMRQTSPPEHIHALDTNGLLAPDVSFYSLREDGLLIGVGALKEIEPRHGEIKSMHTRIDQRGRGLGRTMLEHLLATARSRGYERISLETGTMEEFASARALYVSAGFEVSEPFGDYWDNEFSVCMSLDLG
ncbi:MAG: GNAT family N-acetyltransferase [Acidimicrobiia bacterium]